MVKHSRGKVTERGTLKPCLHRPSLAPHERVHICCHLLPLPQEKPCPARQHPSQPQETVSATLAFAKGPQYPAVRCGGKDDGGVNYHREAPSFCMVQPRSAATCVGCLAPASSHRRRTTSPWVALSIHAQVTRVTSPPQGQPPHSP